MSTSLVIIMWWFTYYFHSSSTANERLQKIQCQMNVTIPLKLKMDVIIRWNSTYFMFDRICELQEPINATLQLLNNPVDALNEKEWEILKNLCIILKLFHEVTEEMSSEKYTTISKVILVTRGLQRSLQRS